MRVSSRLGLLLVAAFVLTARSTQAAGAAGEGLGYIVVFQDSVADPAAVATQQADDLGLEVGHVYSHALKGYSTVVPAGAVDGVLQSLTGDARVALVEPDGIVRADTTQTGAT
jgi:hypothetical protein